MLSLPGIVLSQVVPPRNPQLPTGPSLPTNGLVAIGRPNQSGPTGTGNTNSFPGTTGAGGSTVVSPPPKDGHCQFITVMTDKKYIDPRAVDGIVGPDGKVIPGRHVGTLANGAKSTFDYAEFPVKGNPKELRKEDYCTPLAEFMSDRYHGTHYGVVLDAINVQCRDTKLYDTQTGTVIGDWNATLWRYDGGPGVASACGL
jgi:hypothetical protein